MKYLIANKIPKKNLAAVPNKQAGIEKFNRQENASLSYRPVSIGAQRGAIFSDLKKKSTLRREEMVNTRVETDRPRLR